MKLEQLQSGIIVPAVPQPQPPKKQFGIEVNDHRRREIEGLLCRLHRNFEGERLPGHLDELRSRAVRRLIDDLLGEDFEMEVWT